MEGNLLSKAFAALQDRKRRRRWSKVVSAMACVVVFCTTYALILPAITLAGTSYCGLEEHTHVDTCYTDQLVCQIAEGEGHTHTQECYTQQQVLSCGLEESEGHTHDASCVQESKALSCGLEESSGHTHSDACYDGEGNLICTEEEREEHSHSDDCYTVTQSYVCGLEESEGHTHSESCYETQSVLTCQLEETEGHVHTDACYEQVQTCTLEEHTHTQACFSNPEADVETAADWEKTLPEELTGVWADDVIAVAESQLGYQESEKNYSVTEDGERKGYTRYGAWYGDSYGDWCAMFVSFCLHYAEVEDFPLEAGCQRWIETLSEYETVTGETVSFYHPAEEYTPVPGDLIFFDTDRSSTEDEDYADHVGLVVEVTEASDTRPAQVKTIEGNSGDQVRYRTYELEDETILGYAQLPEKPVEETEEAQPETEGVIIPYTCALEEHTHSDACYGEDGSLTCGLEEHTHSDACLPQTVSDTYYCGLEEHTHSDACGEDCAIEEHTHGTACTVDLTGLSDGDRAVVEHVIGLIDEMPSADEIDAKIEEFEEAEDYDGEEAWLSDVYSLVYEVYYIYYEPLTDNQKACVTNADKLLEMEYIWSATVLASYKFPVNFEVPVVAVNSTEGTSRNEWQGYVLTKSWLEKEKPSLDAFDKPESPVGMAYPYFRGHVIQENSDGSLTVAAAIQAGTLSNYTAQDLVNALGTSNGFILISNTVVEGGIGADYYDATGTVAQVAGFDWKTASGAQTDAAVNMNFTATDGVIHVSEGTPLRNNIQAVGTRTVVLEADLNVGRGPLTLSEGCHITLDLNGHLLTRIVSSDYSGPLFEIPSDASLTIIDSQMGAETVETVGGNTYGNLAGLSVADSGDATLTYYVTETNVINSNTGATQETLMKHTVTTRGAIVAYDQTAFHVTGGYLYIESGMIRSGTNRAIVQTGGLSHISGGYICGFHQPYNSANTADSVSFTNADYGGAVSATRGAVHVTGSAVIAGNTAVAGGALSISGKTQLNITGGVISGNESTFAPTTHPDAYKKEFRTGGGGIILWNGSDGTVLNMTDGYITNNIAQSEVYYDGGGGIFLRDDVTVNLSGGYITGNKASSGGGIRGTLKNNSEIYMTGGFVSGNVNTKAEGAGISMETHGYMELTAGYITNNRILHTEHWGGGGLFCSSSTTFYLKNALITNNDAGGYGGGVAGCPTGEIYLFVDAGCATFDNSACVDSTSPNYVDSGSGKFGIDLQICDEVFRNHGNKDYFCAKNSTVTGIMLGGGSSNWEGTADGAVVMVGREDTVTANDVMGLEARPTEEAKQAAYDVAKVYINGNYSYTHGGGILCNGNLIFGTPDDVYVPARLQLQVTKSLQNSAGEQQPLEGNDFTFQITESSMDGNVVATGTCGTDGHVTFDKQLIFSELGTYTYYISEIPGEKTDKIIYDHAIYRLTLKVDMDDGVTWCDGSTKYSYRVTDYTVEKSKDYGATWSAVTSRTGALTGTINLPLTTGYSFINYTMDFTDITVKKVWKGASEESVTVFLKKDGVRYGDPVTLNSGNNWTYTWKDLESGPEYTVEEETPDGYSVKYLYTTSSGEPGTVTLSGNVWWVPATSLTVGQQYMILSPDRTTALSVTDAHYNYGFDASDTKAVKAIVGDLTINGNSYSSAIADSEASDHAKFIAQSHSMKNKAGTVTENVTILKCIATGAGDYTDSWLMLSNESNGNWLKGTRGNTWASSIVYDGTWLRGHRGYQSDEQLRTFIFRNGVFTTNVVSQPVNGALLYTRVTGKATQTTATEDAIVTITNTLKTNDLTIRKTVEGNSQDQQKPFIFELQLENSRFGLKNQYSAVRTASDGTVTTETIALSGGSAEITLKHGESITIPDLPYGTVWTVTEKNADGYNATYTVNDGAVTSGKTVSGTTGGADIAVSFTNTPGYELPHTGGAGTYLYTLGGALLMTAAPLVCGYSQRRKREGRADR